MEPKLERSMVVWGKSDEDEVIGVWLTEGQVRQAMWDVDCDGEPRFPIHASIVWGAMWAGMVGELAEGDDNNNWLQKRCQRLLDMVSISQALSQRLIVLDGKIECHGEVVVREDVLTDFGRMQEFIQEYRETGVIPEVFVALFPNLVWPFFQSIDAGKDEEHADKKTKGGNFA